MSRTADPPTAPHRASAPGMAGGPGAASHRLGWGAALAIALATALVYARSLAGELVYDDLLLIQRNPLITSLWNIPEIFRSSYWDFLDPDSRSHVGYYRPLTMTLLTLGWHLGGGATWVFHLLSILVHALASIAAGLFVARLARSGAVGGWAGLLFALHPLHVESVAWISAMNDPLAALFAFLALWSFLGWRDRGSPGWPLAAGLLFLPALFSKDAALAVVPLAMAVDLGRRRAPGEPAGGILAGLRPFARGYAPFAAAFLAYYLARVGVFGDVWAGFDRGTTDFGVTAGRLLLLRPELLAGFAWLAVWPADLNLFRPFRTDVSLADPSMLLAVAVSGLLLLVCVFTLVRRKRPLAALVLAFPAALAPVLLNVGALGSFPLSDRFLYIGVVSLAGALAWLAWTKLPRPLAVGALSLVAVLYGTRSFLRLEAWQNEEAMFELALEQNPEDPRSYWGLGRVRLHQYRHTGDLTALEDSLHLFDRGMELVERDSRGELGIFVAHDDTLQLNLGQAWTYFYMAAHDPYRDYETPKVLFEKIVRVYPDSERGYTGLGATLLRMGEHDQAAEALRRAIQMNERSVEAHHDMAQLLRVLGDLDGAERHFRRAMELRQHDLNDMMGLAQTLFAQGRLDEAAALSLRAHELHPRFAAPMVLLGTISNAKNRWADALRWFDRAIELAPEAGELHFERAQSLSALQRTSEAIPSYVRAFELRGNDFQVAYQYARALLVEGRPDAAVLPLVRAYHLRPPSRIGDVLHQELLELLADDLTLQWNLASVSAQRDEWELVRLWCRRALEVEPQHGPSYFLLGLASLREGRPGAAVAELETALRIMPDHYATHVELASALTELERFGEAAEHVARAIELLEETPMQPERRAAERSALEEQLEALHARAG